jgi:hypothetical protein
MNIRIFPGFLGLGTEPYDQISVGGNPKGRFLRY